ncbi:hypothetical protein M0805_004215 [Coniferiporia weirii]|nr:hypothetical protein M0805_004215 [Coniferiporia weirii]
MTTTTMHFGPEWMRAKQPASVRTSTPSSPPHVSASLGMPAPPGASSYSALVTPTAAAAQTKRDIAYPFKYTRDEMLQVWKDGGGGGMLPIEVERWEGVVRVTAGEPACLRELSEIEKKLYASSLNSELRRRQSLDYSVQGDRSKLHHLGPNHGGPLSNGLSGSMGRRRRGDSSDQPPLSLPRKSSWSSVPGSLTSPALPSPRTRLGSGNGFDGVLPGSDNGWGGGKRRMSSGQPLTSRVDEEAGSRGRTGAFEIKEEDEMASPTSGEAEGRASPSSSVDVPTNSTSSMNGLPLAVGELTLDAKSTDYRDPTLGHVNGGGSDAVHMDTLDLAKVQWSYIDLKGDLQGPFPGETMQFWHDQNYFFTDGLMMKRTHIDAEFMPLAEIKRRAQGERIFLSPIIDVVPPPPGLGHISSGPGLNPVFHRRNALDSPRQPTPQNYIRSSTLDSHLNTSSTASGSPSSSYGGNFGRPSISPDHIAVGNRLPNQRFAADISSNGRLSTGSFSSNSSPAMPHAARHVYNDSIQPNRSSSYDAQTSVPWQTPQNGDIRAWGGPSEATQKQNQMGRLEPLVGVSPGGHSTFMREPPYTAPMGHAPVDPFVLPPDPMHRLYEQPEHPDFLGRNLAQRNDHGLSNDGFQQISGDPASKYVGATLLAQLPSGFSRDLDQAPSPIAPSHSAGHLQPQLLTRQVPLSPWNVSQVQEPQRPRPFDADRPTSSNTFVASTAIISQRPAWDKPQIELQSQATKNPWILNQEAKVPDNLGQLAEESQSLTTANVNQHNEQHGSLGPRKPNGPAAAEINGLTERVVETPHGPPAAAPTTAVQSITAETAPQPSSKSKGNATMSTVPAEQTQLASVATVSKLSIVSPSSQKSPWATDEDTKSKQAAAPMGLREIQEAEKKKQEARKAVEKERERAARAATAASPGEEVQFTASWGLPTSQAGIRSNGVSFNKEPSTPSPAVTSAPVWTSASKPAAKTMKEIQEEEERRKLQVTKDKETVASAAKRAAQAPAAKGPLAQQSGGAWTVVSSGGKTSVPASVVSPRPAAVVQVPTPITPASYRPGATVSVPRPIISQVVKSVPPASKTDEEPGAPSTEFMKWMRDSLRGLNSSVQFEEVAQMLLSFPLDPDPSTIELIAETVYGASTTVDGRRFASEFIAKRKADVALRPRGVQSLTGANGKSTSLADVVKAQPKPAQNDFGGYKVVKKKNKGSRS